MKKFNQVIKVEVSVDSIADQLLNSFNPEFKHREMLTETIIALGIEKNTLTYLYNNLNGYTNDINFKEGDVVICKDQCYKFVDEGTDGVAKWVEKYVKIGQCVVKSVNPLAENKVVIEYDSINRDGKHFIATKTVSHLTCELVPVVTSCAPADISNN